MSYKFISEGDFSIYKYRIKSIIVDHALHYGFYLILNTDYGKLTLELNDIDYPNVYENIQNWWNNTIEDFVLKNNNV